MVEHCGGVKTEGEFVHTLTMTDIASGWTECVAMRVRDQMHVNRDRLQAASNGRSPGLRNRSILSAGASKRSLLVHPLN
jgi:hypothetical protein